MIELIIKIKLIIKIRIKIKVNMFNELKNLPFFLVAVHVSN